MSRVSKTLMMTGYTTHCGLAKHLDAKAFQRASKMTPMAMITVGGEDEEMENFFDSQRVPRGTDLCEIA